MTPTRPCILVLNSGSSSIKFALFEADGGLQRLMYGGVRRIGLPDASLWIEGVCRPDCMTQPVLATDHTLAVAALMQLLEAHLADIALVAVGHRIVQGGPVYGEPHRIDRALLEQLRQLTAFDPEHLPAEILLIEAMLAWFADIPQIACFDTAFHHELPRVARLLPIPRRFEALGLRRYGFHGLSYAFLMQELARQAGPDAAQSAPFATGSGSSKCGRVLP